MATDADRLRARLGEDIPSGGADEDTLFSDEEIDDLLNTTSSLDAAISEGWEVKAARLASLSDVAEGNSRRNLSALHRQALTMARHNSSGSDANRVRLGNISRPRGPR